MDCSVAKHLDYTSSSSSGSSSKRDRPEGTRTLVCVDCRTSRTPLWRCGPSGPKSLCNACGIRYLRRTKAVDDKHNSKRSISNNGCNKTSVLSKLGFGRELLQKQRSLLQLRRRRRLGEEEKAAVLLMAISSGLIYSEQGEIEDDEPVEEVSKNPEVNVRESRSNRNRRPKWLGEYDVDWMG